MATSGTAFSRQNPRKKLPNKILVAYTTNNCRDDMTKVTQAIEEGVNVLIWSFIHFVAREDAIHETCTSIAELTCGVRIQAELDLSKYSLYREQLRLMGFSKVVHLVAFGGWNGPHLPSGYSSLELFDAFNNFNNRNNDDAFGGPLFDGIDWDLEGHDDMQSPTNEFTIECLDQMGELSKLIKDDGFIVSMAPPESYLDITSQKFSLRVNLTYPDPWHEDFQYHGRNVYAYVLAKWNDAIDLIFLQFYESFSHAAYQVSQRGQSPSDFLIEYCDTLANYGESMRVDFEDDPSVRLQNQSIKLPLSKLVFGFANGWALNDDIGDKTIFFPADSIKKAYRELAMSGKEPRGVGCWVVEEEGNNGINYIKDLKSIVVDYGSVIEQK
uniref:GH18 domain-containing protein n=1 Tax=Corethron hystrix TaxID=216773 RepID=A0A7S1C127_9STRA